MTINNKKYTCAAIDKLRLWLMFFMCIQFFGLPTFSGGLFKMVLSVIFVYIQNISGFAPIAFFIISGFLVLHDDENRPARIRRTLIRTAIAFVLTAVLYFIVNCFLGLNVGVVLTSKSFWVNFLLLNVWTLKFGSAVWFVQALLYAYIIIFVLEKLKLLKLDWIIFTVCIIFTVISGELSGVVGFNLFGLKYIPGNFLTRALPYVLVGGFVHNHKDFFFGIHRYQYKIGIGIGVTMAVGELLLFARLGIQGYFSHLLGLPVIALSACMLAFKHYCEISERNEDDGDDEDSQEEIERDIFMLMNESFILSRREINLIYFLCQPVNLSVGYVVLNLGQYIGEGMMNKLAQCSGIITFAVCLAISLIIAMIRLNMTVKKKSEK